MEWLYIGLIMLVIFAYNWIKVKIYLLAFKKNYNSFLMTIAYIFGKEDIKNLIKRDEN